MKHSETKLPKGTTHVRIDTPEGKHSTVEVKSIKTLDGVAGTLTFFRMVKNKLIPVAVPPAPAPKPGKEPVAVPGPAVSKANIVPLVERPATAPSGPASASAASPAPDTAKGGKDAKEKRGDKGEFIDKMLTTSKLKLSTILDKTMEAYPDGNRGRTLRRIRKQAVALKKGKHELAYIDEPEFKAGK